MYSIKPGRGPSIMAGIMSLLAAVFGVFWTVFAGSMFKPMFLFGIIFIIAALAGAVYNFYNAGARNRMSELDVTTDEEERDPITTALNFEKNERLTARPSNLRKRLRQTPEAEQKPRGAFCPFCGEPVKADYEYCPKCGKDL